jgi:hypothetical protein
LRKLFCLAITCQEIAIKNSGITIIRYAQNLKIGKPTNLKVLGAIKPKGLNMISKID